MSARRTRKQWDEVIREKLQPEPEAEKLRVLQPMPRSAAAFLSWQLRAEFRRTVVLVSDTEESADTAAQELAAFSNGEERHLLSYPALDPGSDGSARDIRVDGERMKTTDRLARRDAPLLISTSMLALRQMTPSRSSIASHTINLAVGDEREPGSIVALAERSGYELAAEIQERGQIAWRGGIIDVWPPAEETPFRVEFLGDTIETIRSFDPLDQRSLGREEQMLMTPADELKLLSPDEKLCSFAEHVGEDAIYFFYESGAEELLYRLQVSSLASATEADGAERVDEADDNPFLLDRKSALREIFARQTTLFLSASALTALPEAAPSSVELGFESIVLPTISSRSLFEPDQFAKRRSLLLARLEDARRQGLEVLIFFGTDGARDRFAQTHPKTGFHLRQGYLSDGFINASFRLAAIGEATLNGQLKRTRGRYLAGTVRSRARRREAGQTITDWTDIRPGDLVVHVEHGIGRYLGMRNIEFNGQPIETLTVEYANGAKLYVPASQAHLLSRYVGAGARLVQLHRLGGARWQRERRAAEKATEDIASSLLQVQAAREVMAGFAFPPDGEWQHGFEAAFPYEETPDQARAIELVKADMESTRPMDRLVCGDVGYGKTEVALRAAFKAVCAGKQVAMLVPTTVLAQQHFEVFIERMGAYPFNIELLSRFRSRARQESVVRGLAQGAVDIVIGTHRLLQSDIAFKDIGLVIIDEEQRFGVAHKEKLKQMRQLVDVLTLTATPIPRTLHMSLVGARDISMIQTAPEARLPVKTLAAPKEEGLVRDAIKAELERGGQVYYLHNRIATIEWVRHWLQALIPSLRVAVAHGQTPAGELSSLMRNFERGEYDLLLCTTIIQSGLDIPNVNTILIDRADRFGMADLHQLRGRVGRSSRKAYAYLLLPPHGRLMDDSGKRIQAIIRHSDLGAGFQLAVRDLEIRGAGNLLGRDQSGHIAAVGFDLFCQLLKRTVAQLSGTRNGHGSRPRIIDAELDLDFISLSATAGGAEQAACVPESYVEDEQIRLSIYRKIASASSGEELEDLREEFRDRFGPIPPELGLLLKVAILRVAASKKDVSAIETDKGKVKLKRNGDYYMPGQRFPRLRSKNADARLDELISLIERLKESSPAT